MVRQLVLLIAGCATALTATNMRRVVQIQSGPYADFDGRVVCCDSDHDSLPEMMFVTGTVHPSDPLRHEVWEHQGWNRFSLVFADTGEYPEPPGITTGNAIPFAAGDVDNDGLTDIVCITVEPDSINPDIFYDDVITIESPDSFSYPCSLSWYYRCGNNRPIPNPLYYPPDLDQDGHKEIVMFAHWVWENTGDNQNELTWQDTVHAGYRSTFGDFDMDGKMNFASASLGSDGTMSVWECTGDNQYEVVYQDAVGQPNGTDAFMTNDIDGDGKPEFYVAYENVPRGKMYLYMWEMTGDDQYARTLVDSVGFSGTNWGRISECGDIDGDGIDECIWTTPDVIKVYKAVGNDDLQEVWHWNNDHGGFRSLVSTVYDINGDGYNELITAGNAKISIFEIDAVDLVSPNGGSYSVGDTVEIRWAVNTPPACDSLSLFLRRDSLWNLDTIATGLPGTDTSYRWVVPSNVPDTGRIVVIAYGPSPQPSPNGRGSEGEGLPRLGQVAWQFDISDSVIHFTGSGVAEGTRNVPLQWSLSVSPNPARGSFTVRYDVPGKWGQSQPLRGQTEVQSPFSTVPVFALGIYDAGGRLVQSLRDGDVVPGRYEARLSSGVLPAGVYFVRLEPSAVSRQPLAVTKVVVTR
jgi:hypothetical protein